MTDIKHLQDDVAYVRTHVENLERMIAHQIRNDPLAKNMATRLFTETPGLASVYLAFSEPGNQQAVGKKLDMDKSKISRLVAMLAQRDFLRKLNDGKYAWTEFEKLLNLSRLAEAALKSSASSARRKEATEAESNAILDHDTSASDG